jgi:signal transduction histidine kinase/CheY-like chemotaxis protein/sensor domain CHASE-containing protein
MTIRNRILLLFSAIIILVGAVLLLFFKSQKKQNDLMLLSSVGQQVELVNTAINVKSSQLKQILDDYTIWDDLIYNIKKPDQNWAVSNIGTSLESFKLGSVSVYNLNKQLVYNFGDKPEDFFADATQKDRVLSYVLQNGFIHYFYHSPAGIIEIVASTVHPTFDVTHSTPANGVFVISKSWDSTFIQDLSRNTSCNISICHIQKSETSFRMENDSLIVYKPLLDEAANETIVLAFEKSNTALSNFNRTNRFVFIFLCIFLTIVVLSFFLVLYKWVRKPLIIISESLRDGDDSQLNILERNKDEFSQVAHLIRVFNQQKIELEQENTERRLGESQLLRQSNMLRGLTEASNQLLTGENPDTSISKALKVIGEISQIDRIFVFKNESDKTTGIRKVKSVYQWITPEISDEIDPAEAEEFIYHHDENAWYANLLRHKPINAQTSGFTGNMKVVLERQMIRSFLVVPIIDIEDESFWGLVGFADCKTEHHWTASEESTLNMLANNVRNSIRRFEAQENLLDAMKRAQAADRAKSEFLASMSHEIRTPVNGVFGMTSILLHTDLTPLQREYIEIIETSGDNLLNIINEILDFSKIESGHMELENNAFDIRRCIEDVLDLSAPKALEKHLEIMYLIDPDVSRFIIGDGFRLRQILVNLIGNSIKFTQSGEIYIHLGVANKTGESVTLEFSIKDTGIGIPQNKLATIFTPFTQADATTTRKYGGTGLGLAITSNLIKLMKGKIWVESIEGQGSDFRFTIKTQYTTALNEAESEDNSLKILPGKSVLIVDDNPTNRKILQIQCEFWGMKSVTAESGKVALELLSAGNTFDIGILDMQMPEMDGIMLAREMRKTLNKNVLPLIMLTSIGYNFQKDEMHNLFAYYVNKPIKHSQLSEILSKALSPAPLNTSNSLSADSDLGYLAKKYPFEILVAEDNVINQKMIKNVLKLFGYTADIVANGLEVIEALKRQRYELILMDIQMPEMDGYEATRIIVNHLKEERPLIIAMTANAMKSDKDKCMEVGMDDYITKPLKVADLKNVFEYWGEKHKSNTVVSGR